MCFSSESSEIIYVEYERDKKQATLLDNPALEDIQDVGAFVNAHPLENSTGASPIQAIIFLSSNNPCLVVCIPDHDRFGFVTTDK